MLRNHGPDAVFLGVACGPSNIVATSSMRRSGQLSDIQALQRTAHEVGQAMGLVYGCE